MPRADADRNLLFGILALQMDLIGRDDLIAAMGAWALAKHRPLGEILVDRGALGPAERAALEPMIDLRLARHGGDPAASLAALSTAGGVASEIRRSIADPDVLASIAFVTRDPNSDPIATRAPAPSAPAPPGIRYRKVRDHARGGLGVVFVAHDGELNREVALKEIQDRHADDPASRARFLIEAEVTGGLEHPGIVPVYGLGSYEDGRPFYAMRFIRGDSLKEAIARFHADDSLKSDPGARALALQKLLRRFLDVCNAIEYAHSRGVLHRDLKPDNVMVGRYGETLVVDWGLARTGGRSGGGDDTLLPEATLIPASLGGSNGTLPGSIVGTPAYMSPEQAAGRLDLLGPACDVYGLGATLYTLLTGRAPVDGEELKEALRKVERGDFPRPREASPWLDPALEAICLRAMALRPEARHPSPQALADDVEGWAAEAIRSAQVQRIDAVALATFAQVERLEIEARATSDLTRWAQAVAEARRAEAQVEAGDGSDSLKDRIRDKLASLQVEEGRRREEIEAEERDRRMVAELDEARLLMANIKDGLFDTYAKHDAYLAAFRSYGIDVATLPPGEAAARVRSSRIGEELIAALDDWAWYESRNVPAQRLDAIATAADTDPGRTAVNDAIARRDSASLRRLVEGEDERRKLGARSRRIFAALRGLDPTGNLPLLEAIQREHPSDFWFNHDLARAYLEAKPPRPADSVGFYRAALALRPGSPGIHLGLGVALAGKGDHDRADAEYRAAIRIKPDYAEAHYNLGVALAGKGDHDRAVAEFRAAIRIQPDLADAHNNLGNALKAKGDIDGAVAEYRAAIRIQPDDAMAHNNLGLALAGKGDIDGAVAAYRTAIRIQPDLAETHYNLGVALSGKGDHDRAIAEYRAAIRIQPDDAMAHNNLGNALAGKGDHDGAVAEYRAAIRIQPDHADVHYNLGNALAGKGDHDGADAAYRAAIRIQPDLAMAHNNLGNALSDKGDIDGAVAEFRTAIRIQPDLAVVHNNLGVALKAKGDHDGAVAEFRTAIRIQPDLAEAHNNLGVALKAKGDHDGAVAAYRTAIRIQPDYAVAHYGLGVALKAKGDIDGAVAEYRTAIRIQPDDAMAHCNLGLILREKGLFAEALSCLERGHELGSSRADWRYPSEQWVRDCRRLVELDARLPAILKGDIKPGDADERLALANLCHEKKLPVASARFYDEAFTAQSELADDLAKGHRYNAACAAALAGAGRGEDDPRPDGAARAGWRGKALAWLRADLAAWDRSLESGPPQVRPVIARTLAHWKADSDLVGIRDDDALAKLPEAEREAFRSLWADVEALRLKAAGGQ